MRRRCRLPALVLWLGHNARVNMTQRNITFGFDFLWHTAGFDIPFHLLSWENTDTYGYALLVCGLNSLLCAAMSIVLASALGLLIALMRLSGNPLAAAIARGVMEVVRNTPQLRADLLHLRRGAAEPAAAAPEHRVRLGLLPERARPADAVADAGPASCCCSAA